MLRFSTGMRNDMLDEKSAAIFLIIAQTTVSFSVGDGPNGGDKISDSGNGLASAIPSGKTTVFGSASNNGVYEVLSTPGDGSYIEVVSGSLVVEAAAAAVSLATAQGGSFSDTIRNGVIRIFPGTQPSTADTTEGATQLVEISLGAAVFAVGGVNGINLATLAVTGVIGKASYEIWSGVASGTNTAGWFRFYDKDRVTGASSTARRFDGAIGTAGAQLNMSNTSIVSGGTTTIDSFAITLPTL